MKNVSSGLSSLESLVPVTVDLSELSDVVKNDVVKKGVYSVKIKNVEGKISDITNLATNTSLSAKIREVESKTSSIIATATALTVVENKILTVGNLVKKTYYNTKISETEKKIIGHDHDKYIAIPGFNNLTAGHFAARLAQVI